ncbi:MAG: pyruvate dehydrogenase (acetyl-transferring), homodimeric type [Acidobacteriota bacterium]
MSDQPKFPNDIDPQETREWLESLEAVIEHDGPERAGFLLAALGELAHRLDAAPPFDPTTPYVNTIPVDRQAPYPGDLELERFVRTVHRWNAMAMVVRANKANDGLGGHIATYQSASTLFEVGFDHFWHAPTDDHGGDLVFFQGHASPGIYARSLLEGRFDTARLDRFRQEVDGGGLSSYPHPWLMPDYWQFATVSMGLGPLMAIYQARFLKYLGARGLVDDPGRHVWAFLGDGEMDEPESLGAIGLGARENLDNLIFVVNCNLQRLDGPVRGNGKIIQELEGTFRGAGWNVIKVIWGSEWDALLAADHDGLLRRTMMETLDGEYQAYIAHGGAYMREHFFGKHPDLARRVEHLTDDDLEAMTRGGHDPKKVHAAFRAAVDHVGQPTVILAHTVKGYGMGSAGEGLNITHQKKKLEGDDMVGLRDRLGLALGDDLASKGEYFLPPADHPAVSYMRERREALGGSFPRRRTQAPPLPVPALDTFSSLLGDSGEREISTTRAFVQCLTLMLRNKELKPHLVPILADEARTFGMEGMFRQLGIYAPSGQLYDPVDRDQLAFYKESENGQILQEGINEAGAVSSWIAAGMSYSTHGVHMVPFYIYYSMFGFQRVGDFIWAAADMQARGFLLGATSGRTTLNGEGLQHEDGHSHLAAATVPNCIAYDPTFHYEVAVILQDGMRRMFGEADENVFYYLTLINENYAQPAMPEGAEDGILRGMYLLKEMDPGDSDRPRVQLLGSGAILREVIAAAVMLYQDWGVTADIWSVPSFTELRRDGLAVDRRNLLHPEGDAEVPYVHRCLAKRPGPVIASTDYMASFADQIRQWVPGRYVTLGTDGFGRSDTREKLRSFFEVDRYFVTVAALKALADEGRLDPSTVAEAIRRYDIDPDRADPTTV